MSLTSQQNIPSKTTELPQGWTARRLVSFQNAAQTILKQFNILEICLGVGFIATALGELSGRRFSLGWYIILGLILAANVYFKYSQEVAVTRTPAAQDE